MDGYVWSGDGSLTAPLAAQTSAFPTAPTTYTVVGSTTLPSGEVCTFSKDIAIGIRAPEELTAPAVPFCGNNSYAITAPATGDAYVWSTGETTSTGNVPGPGTYTVLVSSGPTGCARYTLQVTNPTAANPEQVTFCGPDAIALLAPTTGDAYVWSTGDTTRSIFVDSLMTYTVRVRNGQSSCNEYTFVLDDLRCGAFVRLPNVFTPNSDGFNDRLTVEYFNIETVELVCFDRWGRRVFETNSLVTFWDGNNKAGTPVPEGVYFYSLKAKAFDGTEIERTGQVTLLR
jgi:gliding motility-associated-like protein